MKKTFDYILRKAQNLFSLFRSEEFVFDNAFQSSPEFKALEESALKAGEVGAEDQYEPRADEIKTRAEAAISKREADFKTAYDALDADLKKRSDEKVKTESPEPKKNGVIDKTTPEWKKWEVPHNAIWAEIGTWQRETAQKKGETVKEFEADRARMYSLRDSAQRQLKSVFEARAKVKDEIAKRVKDRLGKDLNSKARQNLKNDARFAQDLADDGTLSSFSKEVSDYLDSSIGGKKLSDKEIEDMAMGIVSVLNDSKKQNDPGNPARQFMAGLADKEKNSGDPLSTDDRGVTINDVQIQILQNLDYKFDNEEDYEDAEASPAGKLIADIASNQEIPPALRGMLLGQLAQPENKGKRDEAIKNVTEMYQMLRNSPDATKEAGKTSSAYTVVGVLWPGISDSLLLGWKDEEKLERAGAVFLTLRDMQNVRKFNEAAVAYQQQLAITGTPNKAVDDLIKNANTPGAMRRGLPALAEAIKNSEEEYRTAQLKAAAEGADLNEATTLYAAYGLESPYAADLASIKKAKSLTDFVARMAEFNERAKNVTITPELQKKAIEGRDRMNAAIQKVRNYQETLARAPKKTRDSAPVITAKYEPITSTDPVDIANKEAEYATLAADADKVDANATVLASVAPARTGGGGSAGGAGRGAGGGEVAGGSGGGSTGGGTAPETTPRQKSDSEVLASLRFTGDLSDADKKSVAKAVTQIKREPIRVAGIRDPYAYINGRLNDYLTRSGVTVNGNVTVEDPDLRIEIRPGQGDKKIDPQVKAASDAVAWRKEVPQDKVPGMVASRETKPETQRPV